MPRILHIIDSFARTDSARQLLVLSQGLAQQGFDVHVVALGGRGSMVPEYRAARIAIKELDRRWPQDPVAFVRLRRLIAAVRPDVVHAWDFDAGVYGRLAARAAGVRRVFVSHIRIGSWYGSWQWFVERKLAENTQRLIVSSQLVRDWCVRNGLPSERLCVIPPGVLPARVSDVSRDQLLRELKLPADARLIGVVGRLVPHNHVKDLIWAADLLRVLHDNLRLLVIGDGPLRPQLEQYARMASDLDHIRFFGDRSDAWRIMPHLDVLWDASEDCSLSYAILEAMAAGVPVIAGDTPIKRELIIDGETGYLIPLYDRSGRALRARHTDRLFTDHTLAARLATASHQRAHEHFSAERMMRSYAEVYAGSCI
jgi:glycosyltransferase involved in cell wall biosynthesis